MANQKLEDEYDMQKLETVGYHLLPPPHPDSPGHKGLVVLLHNQPKKTNFDPEAIHLKIHNWDGTIHWTTFETDTPFPSPRNICPGKGIVYDYAGNEISFFVFGGMLEGTPMSAGKAFYTLNSTAPVLSLTNRAESVDSQLAIDVEALLAKEQAELRLEDQIYWQHLIKIDPLQLYITCIQMILTQYEQSAVMRQSHYHYYATLQKEQKWLAQDEKWPETVPTLEELLH